MRTYEFYKLIHLFGLFLTFLGLGGYFIHAANGGERKANPSRGLLVGLFGGGMFLVLLGGFGTLARLGITKAGVSHSLPGWVLVKVGVWVAVGALFTLPYRKPGLARPLVPALALLGLVAAYMAIYKPL